MEKDYNDGNNSLPLDVTQKSNIYRHQCQICRAPALHSNYGAMTCASCKMFFKRTAETGQGHFICDFGDQCEISFTTRHRCSACRLAKCFAKGMQSIMIRCAISKNTSTKRKNKTMASTNIVLSTLNLLHSDHSTLTIDQWNLISNLVHCYDEYGGLSMVFRFTSEQNALPVKLRYKPGPVGEFIASNMSRVQRIFEKNRDYLSLSTHDRSILLRNTVKHTRCFDGTFILHQAHLFDNPLFYKTTEMLFGSHTMATNNRLIDSFDTDITFVKLILTVLAFSTTNYIVYKNTIPVNLIDIKTVLRFQDTYTELAWRYMIYKYSFEVAVKRFCQLIRCLFYVTSTVVAADQTQEYTNLIDTVVKQTEQTLTLND